MCVILAALAIYFEIPAMIASTAFLYYFASKQTNRHYRKQYLTVHRQGNVII